MLLTNFTILTTFRIIIFIRLPDVISILFTLFYVYIRIYGWGSRGTRLEDRPPPSQNKNIDLILERSEIF